MHCPGGNATDPIWRVLASSQGISFWIPLKPRHSNTNPHPLAHQLWCIDFLTPPTPLIIPHRLPGFLESLMSLENWFLIHARWSKTVWSIQYVSVASFFRSLKQNFIAYRSSKVSSHPECIREIHQLWQSGFSRVYSNSCCSCWFEPEIIIIGQSSHKMYSNNLLNLQASTTISNACTKKSGILLNAPYIYKIFEIPLNFYIIILITIIQWYWLHQFFWLSCPQSRSSTALAWDAIGLSSASLISHQIIRVANHGQKVPFSRWG